MPIGELATITSDRLLVLRMIFFHLRRGGNAESEEDPRRAEVGDPEERAIAHSGDSDLQLLVQRKSAKRGGRFDAALLRGH